jgi:hypothetical protein
MPDGDVDITANLKRQYDCVGDGLQYVAALCAIAGAIGAVVGMGAGGVAAYGVCSGTAWGLGQASSVADRDRSVHKVECDLLSKSHQEVEAELLLSPIRAQDETSPRRP